jgi:hypothetical protein
VHLLEQILLNIQVAQMLVGRDSSVGIATRYGMDCPGIEGEGLLPIARWDCGFEFRREHEYFCYVCCAVKTTGKTQDTEAEETTMDKLQRQKKRIKNSGPGVGGGVIDFLHLSRQSLRIIQPPTQRVPGLVPGGKQPDRYVNHTLHLARWLEKE